MSSLAESLAHHLAEHGGMDAVRWLATRLVGVVGAGGLGSNCAVHLVRSGFRRLVLADFDHVETGNLNRQHYTLAQVGRPKVEALAENLRAIEPELEPILVNDRVDARNALEIFGNCHCVVEALDDADAKKALAETLLPTGMLVVSASGIGGFGRADALNANRLRDNWIVVGDLTTECAGTTPPMSPMVGAAAAMQADAVLAHFLTRYKERCDAR